MQRIQQTLDDNRIVLFMKGSPDLPQCGFSMRTVEALRACGAQFQHVDVLSDPEIRQHLPAFSNWPTFPQVFINGELIGGCDIVTDLYQRGELAERTRATVTN